MSKREGVKDFGGFIPAQRPDGDAVWPPRIDIERGPLELIKRIEAKLSGGMLVWLRDYDEVQTLAVAHHKAKGLVAARFWPGFRHVILNDDGTVTATEKDQSEYVRHWIAVDPTEKTFMLMKNSETYSTLYD